MAKSSQARQQAGGVGMTTCWQHRIGSADVGAQCAPVFVCGIAGAPEQCALDEKTHRLGSSRITPARDLMPCSGERRLHVRNCALSSGLHGYARILIPGKDCLCGHCARGLVFRDASILKTLRYRPQYVMQVANCMLVRFHQCHVVLLAW